jgi:hypothetical protein
MSKEYDEEEARRILSEQVRTRWEHEQARAIAVLKYQDEKSHVMWAKVARETAELAKAAYVAEARLKLMWYLKMSRNPDEPDMDL